MVEYNAESLKAGLPVVKEVPTCARCHEGNAFVVTEEYGIICGRCVDNLQKERNKVKQFIIQEAQKKMVQNGC